MSNEERMVELLSLLLDEQKNMRIEMRTELQGVNLRLDKLETQMQGVNTRLDRVEAQIEKVEARLVPLNLRYYMKPANYADGWSALSPL